MQPFVTNIITRVIEREGGYTYDQGGHTKYGVTVPFLSRIWNRPITEKDIRSLTEATAREVYAAYFRQLNIGTIDNEALVDLIFDYCVNAGDGRALRELQKAAGVAQDGQIGPVTLRAIESRGPEEVYYTLLKQRLIFWAELALKNPERHLKSLPGWVNRGASFIKNI